MRDEYQDHIPVYLNRIKFLKNKLVKLTVSDDKLVILDEIIDLSKNSIGKIDDTSLMLYFGQKQTDFVENKKQKEFKEQKEWIIDLLCSQGLALIDKNKLFGSDETSALLLVYKSVTKWSLLADDKVT